MLQLLPEFAVEDPKLRVEWVVILTPPRLPPLSLPEHHSHHGSQGKTVMKSRFWAGGWQPWRTAAGGRGCGAQGVNRQAAEAQQSSFPSGTLCFLLIKDPRHKWCPYRGVGNGIGAERDRSPITQLMLLCWDSRGPCLIVGVNSGEAFISQKCSQVNPLADTHSKMFPFMHQYTTHTHVASIEVVTQFSCRVALSKQEIQTKWWPPVAPIPCQTSNFKPYHISFV